MKSKNWLIRRGDSRASKWMAIALAFFVFGGSFYGLFFYNFDIMGVAAIIGASTGVIGLFVGHNASYAHAVRMDDRDNLHSHDTDSSRF